MAILLSDSYKVINWDLSSKMLDTVYWGKTTDSGRGVKVAINQNGVLKTPTTETMRINFKKPSGLQIFIDGVISGNYFVFDFTEQVYAEQGNVSAELMLNVGGEFVMSSTFIIEINQSFTSAIESSAEFTALQTALADVDEVKNDIIALENPVFTEASTLANINSGENNTTLWGKVKKMFSFIGFDITKLASAYSASSKYGTGAWVVYDNKLYRCTTAITVAEAWNASKWTEGNYMDWVSIRLSSSTFESLGTNITAQSLVIEKTGRDVHLNFNLLAGASITAGAVLATIPVGYRPSTSQFLECKNTNGTNQTVIVQLTTSGTIVYQDGTTMINSSYALGDVSYKTV